MKSFTVAIFLSLFFLISFAEAFQQPNPKLTPGVACAEQDPDFKGFDYPSHVARCNRNISTLEKQRVAANYGNIPASEWKNYEFDHLLPLCAGGSNSDQNLWPQPIDEAHLKDALEVQICTAMKAGTMTQDEAFKKVRDWFAEMTNPKGGTSLDDKVTDPATQMDQTFNCTQETNKINVHLIKLSFNLTAPDKLNQLHVTLVETAQENEIIDSGVRALQGVSARTQSGPLAHSTLFSVRSHADRFNLYLPDGFGAEDSLLAYFKVAFEDSYPQLIKMSCAAQ